MANAFIIDEYIWQGHKQVLLERLQGDASGYRVITVKRSNSLDAAKETFLNEIPEGRKNSHSAVIEDYAAKHGVKLKKDTAQNQKQAKGSEPKKGRANAKSKQKSA